MARTMARFRVGDPVVVTAPDHEGRWTVLALHWWRADQRAPDTPDGWVYLVARDGDECCCVESDLIAA